MDENTNVSAEIQEVAEPETEALESAETQEVAEPETTAETPKEEPKSTGKTEQDAAFAEMRRQNQELERNNRLMREALLRYFDGETDEELSMKANAYAEQMSPEEYQQTWEHDREFERLQSENEALQSMLMDAEAERLMRDDLTAVQAIDPNIKSLDELGESFVKMRLNSEMPLTAEEAYYACKARELNSKVLAPDAIGKVSETKAERDYYTSAELDALSDEEMDANWDKVMRSLQRL